jgi:hypothetical protein
MDFMFSPTTTTWLTQERDFKVMKGALRKKTRPVKTRIKIAVRKAIKNKTG